MCNFLSFLVGWASCSFQLISQDVRPTEIEVSGTLLIAQETFIIKVSF